MTVRRRRKNEGGFTLLEALIAGIVFTISAMGLLTLVYTNAFGSQFAAAMTDATSLGSSKLAELLEQEPSTLVNGNDTLTLDSTNYTRTWTVTPSDVSTDRPGNDFVFVEVVVEWTEARGSGAGVTEKQRSVSVFGGKPL